MAALPPVAALLPLFELGALLAVRDHGPGVARDEIERIFEPFYRSAGESGAQGFGLGLAIAHGAVLAHGGAIRASNAEGGGLRLEIQLPLA